MTKGDEARLAEERRIAANVAPSFQGELSKAFLIRLLDEARADIDRLKLWCPEKEKP